MSFGFTTQTLQVDIFSQQLLLVPIHLGVHWATIVVDFTKKEVVYYDSKMARSTGVTPPCLHNIRLVIIEPHCVLMFLYNYNVSLVAIVSSAIVQYIKCQSVCVLWFLQGLPC